MCFVTLCSYICRTDPADVARVESKTYIVTEDKFETLPRALEGAKGGMGQWMAPDVMQKEMDERFRNCMAGMFGLQLCPVFSARQHICYSALYAIARPSVRPSVCLAVRLSVHLSVTRVDQPKMVEVRITQPSPQNSPMTLVS